MATAIDCSPATSFHEARLTKHDSRSTTHSERLVLDFSFSDEQLAIQRLAREFGEREIGTRPVEWDRLEHFPWEMAGQLGALGLLGGVLPERYGGSAMDFVSLVLMVEELSRFCTTTGLIAAWPSCSLGQGMLLYGSEEQRLAYLAPLCRGERLAGTGVTEPHSGTDIVRRMETTCVRDGDDYIVNGAKTWITKRRARRVVPNLRDARQEPEPQGTLCVHRREGLAGRLLAADSQQGRCPDDGQRPGFLRQRAGAGAQPRR